MSHIRSLVNKANQKVTGQGSGSRKRDEQRERTADAWFPARLTNDPVEEEEVPLKRRRTVALDKGKQVQIQDAAPSRGVPPVGEGLFQLPKVWSQSDLFGPQASLYLGDPELKAIRDLGPGSRCDRGGRRCYASLGGRRLSQQLIHGGSCSSTCSCSRTGGEDQENS
jgi:hypothetical protein